MPKLIFRGAYIRFVDLRYDEKSKTTYSKLNLTAEFSEPVREAMGWGAPPEGFDSADLAGDVNATNFILTPNGKELKQHELQLAAKELSAFKLVKVNDDQEGASHYELRFQLTTVAEDAEQWIGQYLRHIGKGEGQLRVNYEEQAEMEMEPAEDSERLISEDQAPDTAEENDGPTLAPAALVGGTHQKGTRKRQSMGTLN